MLLDIKKAEKLYYVIAKDQYLFSDDAAKYYKLTVALDRLKDTVKILNGIKLNGRWNENAVNFVLWINYADLLVACIDEIAKSFSIGITYEQNIFWGQDDGEPFILHLYDNETAAAIAGHVGTANWRLPIYHYDDYENWEVMQYYDIPSRYEIPSGAETVTSEKAGEVYYSEPNRIVLFYGDAEVSGEYTRVGYFVDTEEFREAIENNPALEGWDTKMVLIGSVEQ